MAKRTVILGTLQAGRRFTYNGRPFQVATNLGSSGVSVRPIITRTVKIGDRTFTAHTSRTEVWTASCAVEVEVRSPKGSEA